MLNLKQPLTLMMILALASNIMAADFSTARASTNMELLSRGTIEPFQNNPDDFFQGKYQVGKTTCTVKPIKMAFEVKWARGKRPMIFIFDSKTPEGRLVYVSEDKRAGQDRFIFDNDRFETGKFIRADGTEFPVRKLKKR